MPHGVPSRVGVTLRVALTALTAVACLAAREGATPPFHFFVVADPQFGLTSFFSYQYERTNLGAVVAAANRLRPAFIVVCGDLVHGTARWLQLRAYKDVTKGLDPAIPVYHAAGNHDVDDPPVERHREWFARSLNRVPLAFRHASLAGFVLDTPVMRGGQAMAREAAAQERWLAEALERARREGARHLVVFQHHPWFVRSADDPDRGYLLPKARRKAFLALFERSGVSHVFAGHLHRNFLARAGRVEFVITGPVGQPFGADSPGLRIVTVRDSGVTHRYYPLTSVPTRVDLAEPPARRDEARLDPAGRAGGQRGPARRDGAALSLQAITTLGR